jgi:hypothetical protein
MTPAAGCALFCVPRRWGAAHCRAAFQCRSRESQSASPCGQAARPAERQCIGARMLTERGARRLLQPAGRSAKAQGALLPSSHKPSRPQACEAKRVCGAADLSPGCGRRVTMEGSIEIRSGSGRPHPPMVLTYPSSRRRAAPSGIPLPCSPSRQIPDSLAPAFRPGLDFRDDGWVVVGVGLANGGVGAKRDHA